MKKVLISIIWLILCTFALSAQEKNVSFAGTWELDIDQSELSERSRIESLTMTVTQNKNELFIKPKAKLKESEDANRGIQIKLVTKKQNKNGLAFKLDGTEITEEMEGDTDGSITRTGNIEENGNLTLTTSLNINYMGNEITTTTTETWEISEDGETLTIKVETETQRGTRSETRVFTKVKPN